MNWKHCKWCGLWIRAGKKIYCKMCEEYFDANPEITVENGRIIKRNEGET